MGRDQPLSRDALVRLFVSAGLAAVTLLVYCRTFDHPFVDLDDRYYVFQNRHVEAGLTADGIRYAFTTFDCGNWHPLTWLSLELDSDLYGGLKPGGFHLTNVLLHVANTLLLFLVLEQMTGMAWRSAVVAALFALHPLHVESVAWVAERKDVLSTFFWMLTLAAYLYYVRQPSVGRYLLTVLALALGLLAKPMLVTLPCALLLLDYWPLRRGQPDSPTPSVPVSPSPARPESGRKRERERKREVKAQAVVNTTAPRPPVAWRRLVFEKLPLVALVLAACVITVIAQGANQAVMSLEQFPLGVRVGNASLGYVEYLGKMFWPMNLAAFYPHPGDSVSAVRALGAGVLLAVVSWLVLFPGRRWPYLAVGWLWYLGTLVPVIGLVQVGDQALADRYTYVPLIGIFLALVWGAADLALAWRLPRAGVAALTAAVVSACVVLTWTQIGYWGSDLSLWMHALAVTENNAFAHCGLGTYYYDHDMPDAARQEFERAAAIDPKSVRAAQELASAYLTLGRREEALRQYRRAIELSPDYPTAHEYYGRALWSLGRLDEARAEYQKTLELFPTYALGHHTLGSILVEQGRPEEAVEEFRKAVALDPKGVQFQGTLGHALMEQGRYDEAEASMRRALEVLPAGPGRTLLSIQLERCQRLQTLEQNLPAALEGPSGRWGPGERLEAAELCRQPRVRRYAAAARLYAAALAAEPPRPDGRRLPFRYEAACAAVLAGLGEGVDAANLDEKEKATLRDQGLQWLRTEITSLTGELRSGRYAERVAAQRALRRWQQSADLAGVRDPAALAKLPAAERAAWQELWESVRQLLAEVSG
jgi:tetratricopeptide (TPR) repeat protein